VTYQLYGNTTLGTGEPAQALKPSADHPSNNVEFRKVTDPVKAVKMKTAACNGKILAPIL
uniref:Uncharacterized protein n=1 Tax=Chelonoidis abingdonii TaxID=106734 RepID=A0A8C0JBU6_CHEAB